MCLAGVTRTLKIKYKNIMIKTINFCNFLDEWDKWEDRKDTFSYLGKKAIFEYLECYEESTGEKIELDIIALCCDYTEYENLEEIKGAYTDYFEKHNIKTLDDLRDHTEVIALSEDENGADGVIIQDF